MGYLNDGSLELDRSKRRIEHAFGSCFRGYRNAKVPVWARVSYYDNTIRVIPLLLMIIENGGDRCRLMKLVKEKIMWIVSLMMEFPFQLVISLDYLLLLVLILVLPPSLFPLINPRVLDDHDVYAFETYEIHSAKAKVSSPC